MIKALNYNELAQVCKHAQAVVLHTMQDLSDFMTDYGITSKTELLNKLNELYCNGIFILDIKGEIKL